jgi:HlyD family secretion protein
MSKPSSRRSMILIGIVGLVVIAASVFLLTRPKKAKYRTSTVQRGDISISVSATGTLNPVNQVTVGSQVSGTLEKVLVDFNDHVTAGQVLARIDPRNYESALEQAKANLASAQASLTQAQLTSARAETLYTSGLMAYSDYLQAKTDFELAKAKRDQVQASYDQAQTNLAYTTITAPMAGIIVAREVDAGQTVAASLQSPNLFTIADLSEMQVEVSIDEADVGKLDTGLVATFNVDAYPESTFTGKLVQIRNQPVVSSNVTTYIGIVRVANPGMLLKPGMTANVKVTVKSAGDVLTVPNTALNAKLAAVLGFLPASRTSGRQSAGAVRESQPGRPGQSAAGGRGQMGGRGFAGRGQRRPTRPNVPASESGGAGATAGTTAAAVAPVTKEVFVLQNGKPVPRQVQVGLADATNTEILGGLSEGDLVIMGLGKNGAAAVSQNRGSPFGFGGPPRGGH